ncbi:ComEA family DNA-binding protein [Leucobacter sp. CSA2]|uniref:ComEA family DNA-binding protein n=2 Tax=Leucobacter edaphi TaxID=2796472 RepID=A0A934QAI3_9MICO|nr:ComEA family DNA-binding protein [Leucobacter edaphi]
MNGGGQAPAGAQGVQAREEGRHAEQQGAAEGASRVSGGEKSAPEPSAQKRLLVHVVGEVARPGVVELPAGSRVSDALAAAGGPGPAAELGAVNLARPLVDGEQLLVPNAESAAAGAASAPRLGDGNVGGGVAPGAGAAPIALNAASAESLQQLPGIGPSLAERIIAWRTEHGGFQSVDQLDEVPGIGAKLLERLRERVVV